MTLKQTLHDLWQCRKCQKSKVLQNLKRVHYNWPCVNCGGNSVNPKTWLLRGSAYLSLSMTWTKQVVCSNETAFVVVNSYFKAQTRLLISFYGWFLVFSLNQRVPKYAFKTGRCHSTDGTITNNAPYTEHFSMFRKLTFSYERGRLPWRGDKKPKYLA